MAKTTAQDDAPKVFKQLNYGTGSYLESTSRPLYALLFLLPLIAVYEVGTLLVNTDQIAHTQSRVAAFTWLMGLAEWIGIKRQLTFAFPGFVVFVILLCWHIATGQSWKVKISRLLWMWLECLILTVPLFALGAIMNSSKDFASAFQPAAAGAMVSSEYGAKLVTSIGAGIYEELVFRLILMGLVVMLFEDVLKSKGHIAAIFAVSISSLLFSTHHYYGVADGHIQRLASEPFTLGGFVFRAIAGVYFAVLFRLRGYGITAGTHAAYNIVLFSF